MALSNAERQRLHYQRQKEKKKGSLKQPDNVGLAIAADPFCEWFQGQAGGFSDFALCFDMAGMKAPDIDDDSDPKSLSGEIERSFADEPERSPYARGGGSLARAEIMVGCLIDAASELARIINAYKRNQIASRLREIENADLSDPSIKKDALAEVVQLQKMHEHLDKQVRWSFPQWKLAGE
ncbi:hypothetical protein [Shinella sp. DD12]|uniref:hypothetical protein n=1 Tax=Shinella sp. DD12 TaxID=1410620 RepID=UPI0003C5309D|nr:hypothetical protein [Shinella sp. DD12]EYR81959.1 hypothetical protein SHLA_84c000070 [Shinella sp. DD12]